MRRKLLEKVGDALVGEVARQTKAAVGNTGHDDYSDLIPGGLESEAEYFTLDRIKLARVAIKALQKANET